MKKQLLIFVLALTQNFVFAQKNFLDQAYLETQATADSLVTPDKIYLSININEADSKNKKSVEQQEKEMETALKQLGINTQKDLTLTDLASNFKSYLFKGQNVLKSKQYELLVRDAMTAGKVLIALENLGISNTYISKTEYSKAEDLIIELKTLAVAKSKKIAEKIVKPLGQKIGKAVHISENNTFGYSADQMLQGMAPGIRVSKVRETSPIDIEIKKIKLQAEVFVKYILE